MGASVSEPTIGLSVFAREILNVNDALAHNSSATL